MTDKRSVRRAACPKCGAETVPATGIRVINEQKLANGWSLGTQVSDTPHRGPMLVTDKTYRQGGIRRRYWVCQDCEYDWTEETTEGVNR